jgi:hypothetical protein
MLFVPKYSRPDESAFQNPEPITEAQRLGEKRKDKR